MNSGRNHVFSNQKYEISMHRLIALLLISLSSFTVTGRAADLKQGDPYNVVVITIDDLNDWTGFLGGHPQALTPELDAFAERSTSFTNAHAQAPVCGPSRASMWSSTLPAETGIYGHIHDADSAAITDSTGRINSPRRSPSTTSEGLKVCTMRAKPAPNCTPDCANTLRLDQPRDQYTAKSLFQLIPIMNQHLTNSNI